jgi:uncharacterized membrane protein YdbT with pleckstrin-like domain
VNDGQPNPTPAAISDASAALHWIVFGRALFAFAVTAVFLATRHHLLGLVFFLAALSLAVEATLRLRAFKLRLAADQIAVARGLAQRETIDIPLARLRSISVRQGPGGRLLGYGALVVTSSTGSEITVRSVAAPFAFRLAVLRRLDDLQSRTTEVVTRPLA